MSILTEFSQSIDANHDLQVTVQSILENVSRFVSSDLLELTLWDAEDRSTISYHLQSSGSDIGGLAHALVSNLEPYNPIGGASCSHPG